MRTSSRFLTCSRKIVYVPAGVHRESGRKDRLPDFTVINVVLWWIWKGTCRRERHGGVDEVCEAAAIRLVVEILHVSVVQVEGNVPVVDHLRCGNGLLHSVVRNDWVVEQGAAHVVVFGIALVVEGIGDVWDTVHAIS